MVVEEALHGQPARNTLSPEEAADPASWMAFYWVVHMAPGAMTDPRDHRNIQRVRILVASEEAAPVVRATPVINASMITDFPEHEPILLCTPAGWHPRMDNLGPVVVFPAKSFVRLAMMHDVAEEVLDGMPAT
ncbi:hypothetical protein N9L68_05130 [bacterium]|nr:hypothetical protein [bacterium]